MRDNLRIKQTDATHFEIRRTMTETVNRANMEDRKRTLEMQIETLTDQLDTLKNNLAAVNDALKNGLGQTEKNVEAKAVGEDGK
jgi:hypothetical protein